MMKKLFLLLLLSANIFYSYSQTDTEFWFACPDLSSSHFESCISFQIMSFDQPVTVTITQPANPNFNAITKNLAAFDYVSIPLGTLLSFVETKHGGVRSTGILIQSTANISAYYANTCDNSEIYALKGRNALGTEFLVPTQYEFANSSGYGGNSSVEIVASEDSTDITITPAKNCIGYPSNIPFTIRLNRGESFALRAAGLAGIDHLYNTRINASKPIAVNYTDDSVAGPGVDLIGDQLVPNSLLGTDYIAVRNDKGGTNNDRVYIFPVYDNTTVKVNGVSYPTMNMGDKMVVNFTSNVIALHITSDNPVSVLQLTYNGSELGASILPALSCTGSQEISYKPTQNTARVTIVTKTENIDYFTLNGNSFSIPASRFVLLADDPTWSYFRQDLNSTTSSPVMLIKNSKGVFHAGFLESPGTTCSYGYFSNYNKVRADGQSLKPYFIEGEDLKLYLSNISEMENISWKQPDGNLQISDSLIIQNVGENNSGMYIINADHVDGCEIIPDTMFITVFPRDIQKNDTINICYGNNATITAEGYPPYSWSTPASSDKSVTFVANASSTVTVENSKAGTNMGVMLPDTLCGEKVKQLFEYMIPTEIIQNESYVFSADVEYSGGTGVPHIYFTVNGQIFGGQLGNLQPNVYSFNEKIWTSNSTHAKIGVFCDDSDRDICVKNLNFSRLFPFEDRYHINVLDSLKPNIQGDLAICNGAAVLSTDQNYETYLWSNGATTKSITINEAGDYWVRVTNGDCKGSGSVTILPQPEIDVEIDGTVEICLDAMIHVTIPYVEKEGEVGTYSIYFENRDYFQYIENRIPHNSAIEFPVVNEVKAGIYGAELKFVEKNCGTIAVYPLEIMIKYPSEIITQRWNDVLGVKNHNFNGGYNFVAYQWYKNGLALEGAVKSYFYEENGFAQNPPDRYSVLLTNENNEQIFTCDFEPEYIANAWIQTTVMRPKQIIKSNDERGKAIFWNITGTVYSVQTIENNQVVAPEEPGIYILQINEEKKYKIMVYR